MTPRITVVILNWNGLQDTIECLKSLEKVTFSPFDIVVVDNASTNDEASVIEEQFPYVSVIRNSENLGFCGGCNVGIRFAMRAGSDLVLLLNNDTIVTPSFLERMVEGLRSLEDVGAISPLVSLSPKTSSLYYSRPRLKPEWAEFDLKAEGDNQESLESLPPYEVLFAIGSCMLVPITVFENAGLLDERYFAYYDEIEWCYRARKFGYKSYVVPTALVHHLLSRSTDAPIRIYLTSRNRLLWLNNYLPLVQRLSPYRHLMKDALWHMLNTFGLIRESKISKIHSQSVLRGTLDYFRGRFYKWDHSIEKKLSTLGSVRSE